MGLTYRIIVVVLLLSAVPATAQERQSAASAAAATTNDAPLEALYGTWVSDRDATIDAASQNNRSSVTDMLSIGQFELSFQADGSMTLVTQMGPERHSETATATHLESSGDTVTLTVDDGVGKPNPLTIEFESPDRIWVADRDATDPLRIAFQRQNAGEVATPEIEAGETVTPDPAIVVGTWRIADTDVTVRFDEDGTVVTANNDDVGDEGSWAMDQIEPHAARLTVSLEGDTPEHAQVVFRSNDRMEITPDNPEGTLVFERME